MLGTADVMAFVATKDAERAKTFYAQTLGLRLIADERYALVFDANGTMLRVQKVRQVHPAPYTALGWKVSDIRGTVRALIDKGVTFLQIGFPGQDALGIWAADDGTMVAWFKDPDGNTLSLSQFPASPLQSNEKDTAPAGVTVRFRPGALGA